MLFLNAKLMKVAFVEKKPNCGAFHFAILGGRHNSSQIGPFDAIALNL